MRIAIIGAGAIGGFIAGTLAKAGTEVAILARGAHLEAIRRSGLHIRSELGEFTVKLPAAEHVTELEAMYGATAETSAFDYFLLTFKAHQWPGILPELKPYQNSDMTIVTLQNGVPFWFERTPPLQSVDPHGAIGAIFPDRQIIGGVLHASGNIAAPGVIEQSRGMRYPLGECNGEITSRLRVLSEAFRTAQLQAEEDRNIRATLWLKLLNNTGQNPVSALTGMTIREMFNDPPTRAWIRELMVETLAVGQAMHVIGSVDIEARIDYAARLSDVKTSMLQDREAGRTLELDPILGATIELGKRYNISTPRLCEAYDRLQGNGS